jgi:hypothetical protein
MNHFIQINNEKIPMEELLFFDSLNENGFLEKAIENEIIKQESRRLNIINKKNEVMDYVNNFKILKGIENREKYDFWLKNRYLTEERFIGLIDFCLLKDRLCNSISENTLKEYYDDNMNSFDKICLHSFTVYREEFAHILWIKLKSGNINFRFPDLKRLSDKNNMVIDEFIGWIVRKDITSGEEEIIFDKNIEYEEIIGPYKSQKGYSISMILSKDYSDFEKDKNNIRMTYFNDYIYKLRLNADIKIENL